MIEVRPPEERDRDALAELRRLAFNIPPAMVARRKPLLNLDWHLCAYEGDRVVGTALTMPLRQWFGGRPVPMAGIAGVTTSPERRGAGVATAVMRESLARARASGAVISTLFPANLTLYRKLGYEIAGMQTEYRTRISALPSGPSVEIEEFADRELLDLKDCYRRLAETQNGLADTDDEDWWFGRVIPRWLPDQPPRTVVVRGPGGVDGYAAYVLESGDEPPGFLVECTHLVGTSGHALQGLLAYFNGFRNMGTHLSWHGPPVDPIALLLPERSLKVHSTFPFMCRLLDVQAALEARGYPPVEGEAVLDVADPMFEENRGPFLIEAESGKVRVTVTDREPGSPIAIGSLSSLYTGHMSALDLARLGRLEAGAEDIDFLTRLFAGPAPWMPDFF